MPLPRPRLRVLLRRAAALCLALAPALPAVAAEGAEGASWVVVAGVEAGDALTVRAEPRGDAEALGALPPGALALATGETARSAVAWSRVATGELQGWVANRFLAPARFRTLDDADLPAEGICAGAEPFWSARWADGTVTLAAPDAPDRALPITAVPRAEGRPFGVIESAAPDGPHVLLSYAQTLCGDTMSDAPSLGTARLFVIEGGETRWYSGCCRPLPGALAAE